MAFSVKCGQPEKVYYLHQRREQFKSGHQLNLYFFADAPGEEAIEVMPSGYEVFENAKTGLPFLKIKA